MTDLRQKKINITFDDETSAKDKEIASLLSDIEKERDQRKEERFVFIIAILIIGDAFAFQNMSTWGGPIGLVIMEIILIVCLLKRSGMEHIIPMLERIANGWAKR